MNNIKNNLLAIAVLITYIIMVTVNGLANALPINGQDTGTISDSYANLFAPAGITFTIWGLIYLLLLGHSIYQLIKAKKLYEDQSYKSVGLWFTFSSILNTIWIFAWHYEVIWLSLILMVGILVSLIRINMILRNMEFSFKDKIFIRIPFAVYFGWITVASIANVTTFLVSVNWNGFGVSEVIWTDMIIIIGAVIGFVAILYYKSISYGLVIIWAYLGILIKHTSPEFFDAKYPSVIASVVISILVIIVGEIILIRIKSRKGVNNG